MTFYFTYTPDVGNGYTCRRFWDFFLAKSVHLDMLGRLY
jgi:hypothetical protein